MLKVFDLFSGCGGFRLALEKAGCEFVGYCEIDRWAAMFYKNYFNTKNEVYFNDATKINTREMPDFDILCAGFPCQSFSIAGKRQGFKDTRGTLFFDVARILSDKRPRYFILENVKGLLNHDNGKTFITIIKTLSDLGYNVEWSLLNSKFFGVPQNRERVFIIGYLGKRRTGQIFPLSRTTTENNKSNKTEKIIYWKNSRDKWVEENRTNVGTIKTQSDLCRQPLLSVGTLRTHKIDGSFRKTADNMCPTIPARAREDGSGQPVIIQLPRGNNKGGLKKDCPTITKNQWEYNNLLADTQIRRLTPLECFRLQGFPDDIINKAKELKISDSQLYKMAGNSVTTNVVYEVAKRLINDSIG